MKIKIFAAILAVCGFCMQSQSAVMELGYCHGEVSEQTISKVGNCDVSAAVILSPQMLKPYIGADITGIRLYLATTDNLVDLTAWVRGDLEGENLAEGIGKIEEGWQTVALGNKIKVGDAPIVIGYTFNQTKTSKCIALGGDIAADGHYYAKKGSWESFSTPTGSICVELVVEGDMVAASDLAVESIRLASPAVKEGDPIIMKAKVRNASLSTVEGFGYSATCPSINHNLVDGTWSEPLQPKQAVELELTIPTESFPINEALPLSFFVKDTGSYKDNDLAETLCGVYDEAYPRMLLLEEFTTEECPNCPRAINSIASAIENGYGESMIVVAHHVGFYTDWLTLPEEKDLLWFFGDDGSYAPAVMYDRTVNSGDPSVPVESIGYYDTFSATLDEVIGKPGFVKLDVQAQATNDEIQVTVEAEAHPLLKTLVSEPRLTVLLIEDGIRHLHQAGISNPEFTHSHASRAYLTGIFGDAVEFHTNGTLSWKGSIARSEKWNPDNMEAVVFVNAYDPDDRTACQVYNVAAANLSTSGVGTIADSTITHEEYYDLAGRRVTNADNGLFIKVERLSDGSISTSKAIR